MKTLRSKYQFFVLLAFVFSNYLPAQTPQADKDFFNINIIAGATHADWERSFLNVNNKNYLARWSAFGGVEVSGGFGDSEKLGWASKLIYKETSVATQFSVVEMSDISISFGPQLTYKRINFGTHATLSHVINRQKSSNNRLTCFDLESIKDTYASVSLSVLFRMTDKISIFGERSFLNSPLRKIQKVDRLSQPIDDFINYYPRWMLLGLSYKIL